MYNNVKSEMRAVLKLARVAARAQNEHKKAVADFKKDPSPRNRENVAECFGRLSGIASALDALGLTEKVETVLDGFSI